MRRSWAALLLVVAGCGGARAASADLQLGFDVASQRARLAEAAVGDMQDQVRKVEEVLREQGLDRATTLQTQQQLQADVAALRGTAEELRFALDALKRDLDALKADHERRALHAELRLDRVEEVLGLPELPPPGLDGAPAAPRPAPATSTPGATPAPTAAATPVPEVAPATFDERLALAEKRMEEGKQAVARAILEMALQDEPKHAKAAEATYRIAETWYNEGKWREAAKKFQVVIDEHPKSAWTSWSTLRIGECFEGMGRPDAAKTFYEGVLRNFPSSDAARDAKKKLGR